MDRKAWRVTVGSVLAQEPGQKLSLKRVKRRSVKAARDVHSNVTKIQLQNSFDDFIAGARASKREKAFMFEGKHLVGGSHQGKRSKPTAASGSPSGVIAPAAMLEPQASTRKSSSRRSSARSRPEQVPPGPSAAVSAGVQGLFNKPGPATASGPTTKEADTSTRSKKAARAEPPVPLPPSKPDPTPPGTGLSANAQARAIKGAAKEHPAASNASQPARKRDQKVSKADSRGQPTSELPKLSTSGKASRAAKPEQPSKDAPADTPTAQLARAGRKRKAQGADGAAQVGAASTPSPAKKPKQAAPARQGKGVAPAAQHQTAQRETRAASARKQSSRAQAASGLPVPGIRKPRSASTKAKRAPPPRPAQPDADAIAAAHALLHATGTGQRPVPAPAQAPATASAGASGQEVGHTAPDRAPDQEGAQQAALPPTAQMPAVVALDVDDQRGWRVDAQRTAVQHGRFSEAEKQSLRKAAEDFAKQHDLPTDDWTWLYGTCKGPHAAKSRGAWQAIAAALPHRKYKAVYSAGTRMLHEGNYKGPWTEEEVKQLMELVTQKGRKWKEIGTILHRLPEGCRDKHKEASLGPAKNKGHWSKEETLKLHAAVHAYLAKKLEADSQAQEASLSLEDLSVAAAAEADGKDGRVVLDDIDWNTMSLEVGTRSPLQCMDKWYDQLAPSMVASGCWGSGDDRRLLQALLRAGPRVCPFQVAWGSLVPRRDAVHCQRRWRQMTKILPQYWNMTFNATVCTLARQFAPGLLPDGE